MVSLRAASTSRARCCRALRSRADSLAKAMSLSYDAPLGVAGRPRGAGAARGGVGGSSASAGAAIPENTRTTAPALTIGHHGPLNNLFPNAANTGGAYRYSGDLVRLRPVRRGPAWSLDDQACDSLRK